MKKNREKPLQAPPSCHGASYTISQLCHGPSIGDATV